MSAAAALAASPSVGELTTDVNCTVEHLKELGEHMRNGYHGFTPQDLRNIDEVVAALRELDGQRQKTHEMLEAETITASVLRHRLANFPHRLRAELQAIVSSARDSNATEILNLEAQLSEIRAEVSQTQRRQEILELHNDVLEPEQRKLKTKYAELVKKVNDSMSKKAKMQIHLNETQDRLRSTNEQIETLETRMLRLQEELSRRREEFVSEKRRLSALLDENRKKGNKQREENQKQNKKLAILEEEEVESMKNMDQKRKALEAVQSKIQRLLPQEEDLKRRLKAGAVRSTQLKKAAEDTIQETERMREEYATKERELRDKTQQYKREVELVAAETSRLSGIKKSLRRELKRAQDERDMQARTLSDIHENVNTSKHTLLFQAEESARMEKETEELGFRLAQLQESHQVTVQLCKDEADRLKEQLAKERKTRLEVEESYRDLQSQIQSQQAQQRRTMATLTVKVEQAKRQSEQMADQTVGMQLEVREGEQTIASLRQEVTAAQTRMHSMRTSLQQQIETLEQNIVDLTEELQDRNETLKDIEPTCKQLDEEYEEKNALYEAKKKEIITLKNKRSGLDDTVQRLQRQLEKMHLPQDKLRMDTLRCRAYTRQRLRKEAEEVGTMEERVLAGHQQLLAVTRENRRIEEACKKLEEETIRLKSLFEGSAEMKKKLSAELRNCRESLEGQWKENEKLEQCCSERDKIVLEGITALRNASENRLQTISGISDSFDRELQVFTTFLDIAAKQRPKDDQLHS